MGSILYFLPVLTAFVLFILAREYNDYTLGILSGMLFFLYGVALFLYPMPTIGSLTNLILSSTFWAVGLYIFLRGSMEIWKEF